MLNRYNVFLVSASLLFGVAWLAAAWTGAGVGQAAKAVANLETSEKNLAALKEQVARWEKLGMDAAPSVEPVALSGRFSPGELPNTAQLLLGLYTEHGYFNLKHFKFAWGKSGDEGGEARDMATMSVQGEKVFLGRRETAAVTTAALPAAEGEILKTKGGAQ